MNLFVSLNSATWFYFGFLIPNSRNML